MSTNRMSTYGPSRCSSPKTGEINNKRHKLSKNNNRSTPLNLLDIISPEITPCLSRKAKTNNPLRFYSTMKFGRKSTHVLRAPEGGKSQRVQRGPSNDDFEFRPRDAPAAKGTKEETSRTKRDVLRTIKKMVEENEVIRQRLDTLRRLNKNK